MSSHFAAHNTNTGVCTCIDITDKISNDVIPDL